MDFLADADEAREKYPAVMVKEGWKNNKNRQFRLPNERSRNTVQDNEKLIAALSIKRNGKSYLQKVSICLFIPFLWSHMMIYFIIKLFHIFVSMYDCSSL